MKIHFIITFSLLFFCISVSGCGEYALTPGFVYTKLGQKALLEQKSVKSGKKKAQIEFHEDYALACEKARKEGKPIMLFFYLPNCVFCQQMQQETFTDEDVIRLSQQFVCIKVHFSREEKLRAEYDVSGTPTIQFMNSQGILLQRISAKKSPNQLLVQMQVAIESLAARSKNANR